MYYNPAYYEFYRAVERFLPGYYNIAKTYVGYSYAHYGAIFIFIIMAVVLRYLVKMGLDLSYGRLSAVNSSTINGLSWALGIAFAFGLGRFVVLILNPIVAIALFIILLIVYIRLARK